MNEEKTYTERFKLTGEAVTGKVKELVHEGNVRRLIIRNEDEKILVEIPLTIGAVGVLIAPVAAAIGAIAALVSHCTIDVERVGEKPPDATDGGEPPA
jgi:Domain of unknown function (DUF4342)